MLISLYCHLDQKMLLVVGRDYFRDSKLATVLRISAISVLPINEAFIAYRTVLGNIEEEGMRMI